MTTLQLTKNAKIVLKTRYLLGDETPEDLFWRVARAIAEPEDSSPDALRGRDYWGPGILRPHGHL